MDAMDEPTQQRHKPPTPLERPRELILACPPMKSAINLSRIVRAAGCSGVTRIVAAGPARLDPAIARDGADAVALDVHRSLAPVLKTLRSDGYRIVALEQSDRSVPLPGFAFARRTVLVVGNERHGVDEEILRLADDVVEIPVFGLPFAHNVATATAIAMYEYCRQFPVG